MEHEELINTFISVTSASRDRACNHLEAADWDLEVAVTNFFGNDDEAATEEQPTAPVSSVPGRPRESNTNFGTINAFTTDSESDEEGQAFYVGGHEKGGGQQVLGPKKKANPDKIVHSLFKSARAHGAEEVNAASSSHQQSSAFSGRGHRLGEGFPGETTEEATAVAPASVSVPKAKPVVRTLKMWSNGISVDDGPLRAFEDPATREFLSAVANGHIPDELVKEARGQKIELNMEDHRNEEWSKPKPQFHAFGGQGMTLGSPVPLVATPVPEAVVSSGPRGADVVPVNAEEPTTVLKIRMPTGSPLSVTLNHSHKISDLRTYLTAERPELTSFVFLTTFPTREITDESVTLEKADLLNSALIVRIK